MTGTISKKNGFLFYHFLYEKKDKFSSIFVLFQNFSTERNPAMSEKMKYNKIPKKRFLKQK